MLFEESPIDIKKDEKVEYKVLARKYRPKTFADMIGQSVLVRTFTNAIALNRIPHAFLLTGIRGVGKTTTARIIARALNCTGPDGSGSITANPCGVCSSCISILEDRNQDVIEIDAASHTGVADIREVIESSRYKPISARYKVFIIDEVHMLSISAFNALLKTLEEPPAFVKFIFATTETRKIPITILSRCQRFDLRRVEQEVLYEYLYSILKIENCEAEGQAIKLIASVADGSVRDALSILDQAISNSTREDGSVYITARHTQDMLGLADKQKVWQLYDSIIRANTKEALDMVKNIYADGADVTYICVELIALNHLVIKSKASLDYTVSLSEDEGRFISNTAQKLEMPTLIAMHNQLSNAIEDLKRSYSGFQALEVIIIKLIYTSSLPSLYDILNGAALSGTKPASLNEGVKIKDAKDIVNILKEKDEIALLANVTQYVAFAGIQGDKIEVALKKDAPTGLIGKLNKIINEATGIVYSIALSSAEAKTLFEIEKQQKQEYHDSILQDDGVQEILASFSDATIEDISNTKLV